MDEENSHLSLGTSVERKVIPTSEVLPTAPSPMSGDEEKLNSGETQSPKKDNKIYLTGWKLHLLMVAICLSMLLSSLETTIVSTSLVTISDSLQGYSQASWIITAYLLTYTGFLIAWAKVSDIVGRKTCLVTSIIIFVIASGACGSAQTMTQLIIFRAFQGMGGSGTMSLGFVVVPEMVPANKFALYGSITSFTFAIAYLLGPILGGVINDNTTWRWVFLINPPAGALALVLVLLGMPTGFPDLTPNRVRNRITSSELISRVDFPGFLLLLSACAFMVVALEESGIQYAWSDPIPIAFLVLSGLLWIGFFAWSKLVTSEERSQEPVFTWNFIQDRDFLSVLLVDFLAGVPFFVTIVQLPQRFQIVNGTSALQSGVRMLPFILCVPMATMFSTFSASKLQIPPIFTLAVASAFQIIGTALLSTIGVDVPPRTYGFEVILGVGIGLNIGSVVMLTPNIIKGKDQSVAMAVMTQLRALGGVIGLSIAANVLNNKVKGGLANVFTPQQLDLLLQTSASIDRLPPSVQATVQNVYADGYSLQQKIMIAFAGAQMVALALMWKKKPRRVV